MAIIDSQLSVTNLDVGLASSTSETDNKNGFLAVLTSVQNEADAKQRAAENEQAELLRQEESNEADKQVAELEHEERGKSEDNNAQTDESDTAKQAITVEKDYSQDDVSSTRSKDFQQFSSLTEDTDSDTDKSKFERSDWDKSQPLSKEETKANLSGGVNDAAQKSSSALQAPENADAQTEDATSFLEQLAKSQSLNVELSKTTNDQALDKQAITTLTDKTIDKGEPKSDSKFTQYIVTLDKEFEKLDKEALASLKQLFTQLNDENSEQLGLSKQEIRQVLDKLNLALERVDTKPSKQTVTLQSVLTKSMEGSEQTENAKNDGVIKLSENTKSSLTQLVDDGKIIIPSDKSATITRPDKQVPHSATPVSSAIAQAITEEAETSQLANQKTAELVNQPVVNPVQPNLNNQDSAQKQQSRAELNNMMKQIVTDTENVEAENEFDFGDQASEQSMSFSKLLNSLKNNANTPVLSQLVSQIQSSQLQQAELRDVNQQHIALQTAQVMQNTKEVNATAEQVLQQPVNIARNDAAKALFDKANMLLNLNLKEAEIRLDPPELGSMQIRIRSDAEQAQINFVVQSQQAKEMLEQSMGRLKEMLAEQGINLGESSVSEQGQNEQQMAEQSSSPLGVELSADDSVELSEQILSKQQDGIDFYA